MTKSFRFWVRCHTVALLCGIMIVNPVWAGRGLRGWFKRHHQSNQCCVVELNAVANQW